MMDAMVPSPTSPPMTGILLQYLPYPPSPCEARDPMSSWSDVLLRLIPIHRPDRTEGDQEN